MKAIVKVGQRIGPGESHGWANVERTVGTVTAMFDQFERAGIDIARDFTIRYDHAGQVVVANQE